MKLNCFELNWIGILRKQKKRKKVVNVNNFDCVKIRFVNCIKSVGRREREGQKKGRAGARVGK